MRHAYQLTDKGRDLFPWFLALLQWGDKWCDPDGRGRPMLIKHSCGKSLDAEVRCNQCCEHLKAHEVEYTLDGEVF